MTIGTILVCVVFSVMAGILIVGVCFELEFNWKSIMCCILAAALIFGLGYLYQHHTASGKRALTDYKSEFQNGLERTLTIYTADGTILKQYKGKFDIADEDGYIKFDWNGKRYIYYNCYVETIADIE